MTLLEAGRNKLTHRIWHQLASGRFLSKIYNIQEKNWIHPINCQANQTNYTVKLSGIIGLSHETIPDSKVHGANMGPIWGRQDPGERHVGPMSLASWDAMHYMYCYVLQAGKLKFFGTRPNWVVSCIADTKFHSRRPVFHSPSQIFTRIGERALVSQPVLRTSVGKTVWITRQNVW